MKIMTALLFSIILILTGCGDNNSFGNKHRIGDRLLEDPDHNIKDSPDILIHDSTVLYTGWYYVVDSSKGYGRQLEKSDETYFLDPKPIVTSKNIITFKIYESNYNGEKYFGLEMRLDKEGTENWSIATRNSIGNKLAFILDNRLLQVATVNSQITGGVTALSGDFSRQELENFKTIIESEK
jgi:hypothetical protein